MDNLYIKELELDNQANAEEKMAWQDRSNLERKLEENR